MTSTLKTCGPDRFVAMKVAEAVNAWLPKYESGPRSQIRLDVVAELTLDVVMPAMAEARKSFNEHRAAFAAADERQFILDAITHPAGYDVDLFAMLCVRPTDQGAYCVTYEPTGFKDDPRNWEKCFEDPREAVDYFLAKRNELDIGVDHDVRLLSAERKKPLHKLTEEERAFIKESLPTEEQAREYFEQFPVEWAGEVK